MHTALCSMISMWDTTSWVADRYTLNYLSWLAVACMNGGPTRELHLGMCDSVKGSSNSTFGHQDQFNGAFEAWVLILPECKNPPTLAGGNILEVSFVMESRLMTWYPFTSPYSFLCAVTIPYVQLSSWVSPYVLRLLSIFMHSLITGIMRTMILHQAKNAHRAQNGLKLTIIRAQGMPWVVSSVGSMGEFLNGVD